MIYQNVFLVPATCLQTTRDYTIQLLLVRFLIQSMVIEHECYEIRELDDNEM